MHVTKLCEYCHVRYEARRDRQRFCSKRCQYAFDAAKNTLPRREITCQTCTRIFFTKITSEKKFCSVVCFHKSRIGSTLSLDHRATISTSRKRDWERGVYSSARVGKTQWFTHTKPSGEVIRCQGSWELAYAQYLDAKGTNYSAHRSNFRYTKEDGSEHVYLPDFHLIDVDVYVDVKNDYLVRIDAPKLEAVKRCNPALKLVVVTRSDLMSWGCQV